VSIYPTNDWHERETYDFFGIVFDGHPALTRDSDAGRLVGTRSARTTRSAAFPVEYRGAEVRRRMSGGRTYGAYV